ncbi:hypothetical protein J3458_013396 [Metarhizium acridum]|uniref:uncharacterized protein n=1 Tax=Metarhizium acridum TaxID=92637 RepID=UPI001C6AF42B|nr:hypothetical protein J3458_013396 [Metarhizium acridum]
MVSSASPPEGAGFQTIETAQGTVVVSTDLLTVPKDAADENADVLLKPTTNIVGNTSLSAVSRPNVAGEDIAG